MPVIREFKQGEQIPSGSKLIETKESRGRLLGIDVVGVRPIAFGLFGTVTTERYRYENVVTFIYECPDESEAK